MTPSFGAPWSTVATVVALTAAMYATLLVAVRVAGRRTLAQLSAFDVLVTIALGTILGSTAVSPSVTFVEGLAAAVTLLLLQVALGALRRASSRVRKLVDFAPQVVVQDGQPQLLGSALGPQMTADELGSQLRRRGAFDPEAVAQATLEPIGGVSVAKTDILGAEGNGPGARSTSEVLEAHVRCREAGDLEEDLRENYAADVVLLSPTGVRRGHDGLRALAALMGTYDAGGMTEIGTLLVADEIGLLVPPSADAAPPHAGADSYVVRNGRIVAQTLHRAR